MARPLHGSYDPNTLKQKGHFFSRFMLLELKNHSGHVSLNVCLMCPLKPYLNIVLYPNITNCYTSFYRDLLHRMAMCGFCHLGLQIVGGMLMITRSMVTQPKGYLMYPALPVTCNILLTEVISHSLMHFLAMIWILLWVEALWMSGNRNMK